MENQEQAHKKINIPKSVGTRTLIATGIILVLLGIGSSYLFSKTIEKFFWEVRTKSAIEAVTFLSSALQDSDTTKWENPDAIERLSTFASSLKLSRSNVAALKVYSTDGILAWTDLKNVNTGYKEIGIETEIDKARSAGHLIKDAGESTKTELNKTDLLEVWTIIKNGGGETIGYVEFYFDSSDILSFITGVRYTILASVGFVLLIVLSLLQLAFRRQNAIIIQQAHELSDIVEQSPIGIYTIDPKGIVSSINPKMLELIGEKNSDGIIGQNVFNLKHVQKMNMGTAIHEALLGAPFEKEISSIDEVGNKAYRHYHGVPIFNDDKKTVENVLFMVEDITEQKKLEEEVALHTEELELGVKARTKELQDKVEELEQFERLTVDREIRMTELKQQIEKMRVKLESLGVNIDTI